MCRSALLVVVGWTMLLALPAGGEAQDAKKKPPVGSAGKDAFGDPLPPGAVARIGTTRYRMPHSLQAVAISPDGTRLAALDYYGGEIAIWDLPAWENRRILRSTDFDKNIKSAPRFQDLAFSADSRVIHTFDASQRFVYFIDAATGRVLKKLGVGTDGSAGRCHWAVSSDQEKLLLVESNSHLEEKKPAFGIQSWNLTSTTMTRSYGVAFLDSEVLYANPPEFHLSADGRWLAMIRYDGKAKGRHPGDNGRYFLEVCDVTNSKAVSKIDTESRVHFALSPDGKWLAATDGRSKLIIYDAASGAEKHHIRIRPAELNLFLEFAPDGRSLWIADDASVIHQWDHISGEKLASYKYPPGAGHIRALAFAVADGITALGELGAAVTLWNVTSGKLLSPESPPVNTISNLTFSKKSELFTGCAEGTFAWWNARTAAKVRDIRVGFEQAAAVDPGLRRLRGARRFKSSRIASNYSYATNLPTLVSDGGRFIVAHVGRLFLFDTESETLLYNDPMLGTACFFAGDAKTAAIYGNKIRVWHTASGRDLDSFEISLREKERLHKLAVCRSGTHFVFTTGNQRDYGRTILWDAALKKTVREWSHSLLESPTMKTLRELSEITLCPPVAFSPDNHWLVLKATEEGLLLTRVGSAADDVMLQLPGTITEITKLTFSPDGRQLACAATVNSMSTRESGRIYVYEVASKKLRLELAGHRDGTIACLGYAHDSGLLASGSSDTTTLVWRAGLRAFAEVPADQDATAEESARRFAALADGDAKAAFQAMIRLVQTPTQTVKLLDAKIAPAGPLDTGGRTVAQWIADLGKADFAIRTRANAMLKKIGLAAAPELRTALPTVKDLETKRRVEELLNQFAVQEWTPQELQHARAVEVLEALATPAARALLTRWANGGAGAALTVEARQALARSYAGKP